MAIFYELDETSGLSAKIKVIGVGGGGGNAINNMIRQNMTGVEFIVANTDAQAIEKSQAEVRLQLGSEQTRGLGAGAKPQIGKEAAELEKDHLRELLVDTDMLFITAGMGGGTGTGAAPVIAEVAKEMGILSVGIVTKPFTFEGRRRMKQAEEGIQELHKFIDTLIVIPNQKLLGSVSKNTSLMDSFLEADNVLYQAVKGISDLIANSGYINVDFADVKSVMSEEQSMAMMGTGRATGENRACEAIEKAISSSLLEDVNIQGARAVLINVTGNETVGLHEVDEAASIISNMVDEDANIIFGLVTDPDMGDELSITVVATGLNHKISPVTPKKPVQEAVEGLEAATQTEVTIPRAKNYARFEATKTVNSALKSNEPASYDEKKLNIPALDRQNLEARAVGGSRGLAAREVAHDKDQISIPAWIRKQAD
ncbi:MAG: cell division protein FtsZ [Mariprofundaceae bacterium]|nr:cell division protein FtsZ [Mariprofundaceae bacterium]